MIFLRSSSGSLLRLISGKIEKHLLQTGLADAVIHNLQFFFIGLHGSENFRPLQVGSEHLILNHRLMFVFQHTIRESIGNKLVISLLYQVSLASGFVLKFGHQSEALTEAVLEMLRRSETLELSVDHDGQSGAEVLAFFHGVRSEDD